MILHYIYTNYANHTTYECDASDILEADKLYEQYNIDTGFLFGTSTAKKMSPRVTTWSPDWSKQL